MDRAQASAKRLRPQEIAKLLQQAVDRHEAGRPDETERLCREVLATAPDHTDALQFLGVARASQGDSAGAITLLRQAVAQRPNDPRLHLNLAVAMLPTKQWAEAADSYRRAIALAPAMADAHAGLAGALFALKDLAAAEQSAHLALELQPGNQFALTRLALILLGRGRLEAAEQVMTELGPDRSPKDFLVDAAGQYMNWQKFSKAEEIAKRLVEAWPDDVNSLVLLAYSRMRQGRQAEATGVLEHAVELAGPASLAGAVLGCLRTEQGQLAGGLALLREAVARPETPSHEYSTYLCNLAYQTDLTPAEALAEHQAFDTRWAAALAAEAGPWRNTPDPQRPLEVGFVSPDFCAHSVSFFALPLIAALTAQGVRVTCYSNTAQRDDMTEQLKAAATVWHDIRSIPDTVVADQIRRDGIDVLVDLAGHSADNRLMVFARRPAPIQLTYCGYAATTGMSAFDGRIVDARTDPPGTEAHGSEPLIRLDRCFLAYEPQSWPAITPPPCLANGHVTFGSFNNFTKINEPLIGLWARVLNAVPGSRMVLKSSLDRHPDIRDRFLGWFADHGITADRIDFLTRTNDLVSHLALYGQVDIALDTGPYNGTTTTCEAMWMGVPVITLEGNVHRARVGASLLQALRFEAGIAKSEAELILTASQLASSPELLEAIRFSLRPELERSELADKAGLARAFMKESRKLWQAWCKRQQG